MTDTSPDPKALVEAEALKAAITEAIFTYVSKTGDVDKQAMALTVSAAIGKYRASLPHTAPSSVVKPLRWTQSRVFGHMKRRGSSPFGEFVAFIVDDLTPEQVAAKEAEAEARYAATIKSAIEPSPLLAGNGAGEPLVEAAKMARTRLQAYADQANAGTAQAGGRELARKIWGAFAEFDAIAATLPPVEAQTEAVAWRYLECGKWIYTDGPNRPHPGNDYPVEPLATLTRQSVIEDAFDELIAECDQRMSGQPPMDTWGTSTLDASTLRLRLVNARAAAIRNLGAGKE